MQGVSCLAGIRIVRGTANLWRLVRDLLLVQLEQARAGLNRHPLPAAAEGRCIENLCDMVTI
jgi:hypothetical protein